MIVPLPTSNPPLMVYSRRIIYFGDLTALLPTNAESPVSWLREGDGFVGWGCAASIRSDGNTQFTDAECWWQDLVNTAIVHSEVDLPGSGLIAIGSFAFATSSASGGVLYVPETIVGRRHGVSWVTTISPAAAIPDDVQLRTSKKPTAPRISNCNNSAPTGEQWSKAVAAAVNQIQAGTLDKVVIARDVIVHADDVIDPRYLITRLAAAYDKTWTYSVDGLIGATPEMLLLREKGLVISRILAGTIRRTGDDEHNLALAGSLTRSRKNLEEHEYAVRSVADALSPHCSSINVPKSPFVLHLPNVMHLATDVTGVLHENASSLMLAASLHPSAAVCGTPTFAARDLIAELEQMDRGRYAGPVGWIDAAGDGEWGIALRCGVLESPSQIRIFAGCGIVAGSDPATELAESEAKLLPIRHALAAN